MNYTKNYQLSQWEPSDRVLRTDFNEDNRKIEEALGGIQNQVREKASQEELSALTAQLMKKGNCRIETGSYTGTGAAGMFNGNRLLLSARPLLLVIVGDYTIIVPGMVDSGKSVPVATDGNGYNTFSWSGNTLSWYNYDSASTQLNTEGRIYQYYAIYAN